MKKKCWRRQNDMSKLFFTKKLTKEELCKKIYELVEDSSYLEDCIDSDTDLTDPDTMEAMMHHVYIALKTLDGDKKEKFRGGTDDIEVDTENLSASADDFGDPDFVGFHTLPNGLTFLGLCMGGDWEVPLYTAIFHDGGDTLYEVVPELGNTFNTRTNAAYGNDLKSDAENITTRVIKDQYKGLTLETLPLSEDDSDEAMEALGSELGAMVQPRVDLMLMDIEKDILFYDTDKEKGQMIERPEAGAILQMISDSGLHQAFKEELLPYLEDKVETGLDCLDENGALPCPEEAVTQWLIENPPPELTEKEQIETKNTPLYRIRKHMRAELPNDFPVPIVHAETGDVYFKPGGIQEGDAEGGDLDELNKDAQIEKFKGMNDVRRRMNLQRLASGLEQLTQQVAKMAEFYKELSDIDMEMLLEESKARESEKEDDDGGATKPPRAKHTSKNRKKANTKKQTAAGGK
jgi:uncharacterized protein YlaN (UPF0358 family)/uncharacterized protein YihD (DUF1040 family)